MDWNEPPKPKGWDQPSSDPWSTPQYATNLPDPWAEPDPEPEQLRRSLRKCRNGFSMLAIGLGVACLTNVGTLVMYFTQHRRQQLGLLLGIPHFDFIVQTTIIWSWLIGAGLIWGRWPDESWRRRSGLLLMMCFVSLMLWGLEHAQELGVVGDARAIGHDWFRLSLRTVISYARFLIIVGLASDMAARQGEPGALALGRAARSLTMTGAFVWFMFFLMSTSWRGPLWPLMGRPNQGSFMIFLVTMVLTAINQFQLTMLSLMASRSCGQTLRRMAPADATSHDLLVSPSDAAWREFNESRAKHDL